MHCTASLQVSVGSQYSVHQISKEKKDDRSAYITVEETINHRERLNKLMHVNLKLVVVAVERQEQKNQLAGSILRRPAR